MKLWSTDKKLGMSTKGTHEKAQMQQQSGKRLGAGRERGSVRVMRAERERDKEYLVRKSIRGNGKAS